MENESSTTERRDSVEALTEVVNDQDFKQKMGMYTSFIMEFYRVLMGSFLTIFVPQKCGDHICTMNDNIITSSDMKNAVFGINAITFAVFLHMYYAEMKRENKMITYLHVNPELPRDNDAVGEALIKLPEKKKVDILRLDKYYQNSGRCAMGFYLINVIISSVSILNQYLDDKTVTVLLTNAIFMALKLYDTKVITDTEENVFLSAYLTRKIQYNDVDPDKIVEESKSEEKPIMNMETIEEEKKESTEEKDNLLDEKV